MGLKNGRKVWWQSTNLVYSHNDVKLYYRLHDFQACNVDVYEAYIVEPIKQINLVHIVAIISHSCFHFSLKQCRMFYMHRNEIEDKRNVYKNREIFQKNKKFRYTLRGIFNNHFFILIYENFFIFFILVYEMSLRIYLCQI